MGIFLFLISFPAAIVAWVLVARKLKVSGKSSLVRHFLGIAAGFIAWVAIILIGVIVDPVKPKANIEAKTASQAPKEPQVQPKPATVVAAATIPNQEAQATETVQPKAVLDMDWDTFRNRVNDDFIAAGIDLNIPSNVQPNGDEKSVQYVASLPFNDHLQAVVSEDPTTKKLTGISIIMGFSAEDPVDNVQNVITAALVLSSASGDEGNKKVGGKIIKMINTSLETFEKQLKKEEMPTVKNHFNANGVRYGILISKALGTIMLFAEPEKAEGE